MSTPNHNHQTNFEFDETFWAWVQQEPKEPRTPACPLEFFKHLHEDHKLPQKMQQVYDRFFDEMDRFDQEMEDACKQCNRPKERIQEAMSYLKCTPTYAAELFKDIDEARRQVEQEALAERRRAWALHVERHRAAQADAQRRADYQRALEDAYARAYVAQTHGHRYYMHYYY